MSFKSVCSNGLWKQGCSFWGFCRTGAHYLGEKSLLGLEDLRSRVDLISIFFSITRVPFLISLGWFITAYLFITEVGRILEGGHTCSWSHRELKGHIYSYNWGISYYDIIIPKSIDLQHFSEVWKPKQARPNFLGGLPAREGCNSARTTTQKIEGKEIDLSYLVAAVGSLRETISHYFHCILELFSATHFILPSLFQIWSSLVLRWAIYLNKMQIWVLWLFYCCFYVFYCCLCSNLSLQTNCAISLNNKPKTQSPQTTCANCLTKPLNQKHWKL